MRHVEIEPLRLERLAGLLEPPRGDKLLAMAERARALIGDRIVWNVSSTAQGGGVAEMLQTLLAYARGAGVDTRWLVLRGDPEFFTITKRLHNVLHGEPGDGRSLGEAERAHYEAVLADNLIAVVREVRAGDIVLLHDPQPAGLVDGLKAAGAHVVWRCHIGRDTPNALTELGWAFLQPYLRAADAFVFSRRIYAPSWVDGERLWVIPPSIDPFTAKNQELGDHVDGVLCNAQLCRGGTADCKPLEFTRRDGRPDIMRRHEGLLLDGSQPPSIDARLVLQVSRWDRLKDMEGVMRGFVEYLPDAPTDVHLMLVGPEVGGVSDDPEGAQVLSECLAAWRELPPATQARIHLVCLPMDDIDENAIMVNALQRHAYVVVQKSLVEGFGLTVTEAMWKGRPVIASAVGGIQDQIVDGRDGLLLADPTDVPAFATALARIIDDPALAARLGAAGRERVRDAFLGDRHLIQYIHLIAKLRGEDGGREAGPGRQPVTP
jgi:trehalose synthase